jgi:hypothetical protein
MASTTEPVAFASLKKVVRDARQAGVVLIYDTFKDLNCLVTASGNDTAHERSDEDLLRLAQGTDARIWMNCKTQVSKMYKLDVRSWKAKVEGWKSPEDNFAEWTQFLDRACIPNARIYAEDFYLEPVPLPAHYQQTTASSSDTPTSKEVKDVFAKLRTMNSYTKLDANFALYFMNSDYDVHDLAIRVAQEIHKGVYTFDDMALQLDSWESIGEKGRFAWAQWLYKNFKDKFPVWPRHPIRARSTDKLQHHFELLNEWIKANSPWSKYSLDDETLKNFAKHFELFIHGPDLLPPDPDLEDEFDERDKDYELYATEIDTWCSRFLAWMEGRQLEENGQWTSVHGEKAYVDFLKARFALFHPRLLQDIESRSQPPAGAPKAPAQQSSPSNIGKKRSLEPSGEIEAPTKQAKISNSAETEEPSKASSGGVDFTSKTFDIDSKWDFSKKIKEQTANAPQSGFWQSSQALENLAPSRSAPMQASTIGSTNGSSTPSVTVPQGPIFSTPTFSNPLSNGLFSQQAFALPVQAPASSISAFSAATSETMNLSNDGSTTDASGLLRSPNTPAPAPAITYPARGGLPQGHSPLHNVMNASFIPNGFLPGLVTTPQHSAPKNFEFGTAPAWTSPSFGQPTISSTQAFNTGCAANLSSDQDVDMGEDEVQDEGEPLDDSDMHIYSLEEVGDVMEEIDHYGIQTNDEAEDSSFHEGDTDMTDTDDVTEGDSFMSDVEEFEVTVVREPDVVMSEEVVANTSEDTRVSNPTVDSTAMPTSHFPMPDPVAVGPDFFANIQSLHEMVVGNTPVPTNLGIEEVTEAAGSTSQPDVPIQEDASTAAPESMQKLHQAHVEEEEEDEIPADPEVDFVAVLASQSAKPVQEPVQETAAPVAQDDAPQEDTAESKRMHTVRPQRRRIERPLLCVAVNRMARRRCGENNDARDNIVAIEEQQAHVREEVQATVTDLQERVEDDKARWETFFSKIKKLEYRSVEVPAPAEEPVEDQVPQEEEVLEMVPEQAHDPAMDILNGLVAAWTVSPNSVDHLTDILAAWTLVDKVPRKEKFWTLVDKFARKMAASNEPEQSAPTVPEILAQLVTEIEDSPMTVIWVGLVPNIEAAAEPVPTITAEPVLEISVEPVPGFEIEPPLTTAPESEEETIRPERDLDRTTLQQIQQIRERHCLLCNCRQPVDYDTDNTHLAAEFWAGMEGDDEEDFFRIAREVLSRLPELLEEDLIILPDEPTKTPTTPAVGTPVVGGGPPAPGPAGAATSFFKRMTWSELAVCGSVAAAVCAAKWLGKSLPN